MKHNWKPGNDFMAHTDTGYFKLKVCANCGCQKQKFKGGIIYMPVTGVYLDKMPECFTTNQQ